MDSPASVLDRPVPLLGTEAEAALDAGLRKAGVFCSLCGRSAVPNPFGGAKMVEYLIVEPRLEKESKKAIVNLVRVYHCGRDDCDATEVRERAQATRLTPAWESVAHPADFEAGEEDDAGEA